MESIIKKWLKKTHVLSVSSLCTYNSKKKYLRKQKCLSQQRNGFMYTVTSNTEVEHEFRSTSQCGWNPEACVLTSGPGWWTTWAALTGLHATGLPWGLSVPAAQDHISLTQTRTCLSACGPLTSATALSCKGGLHWGCGGEGGWTETGSDQDLVCMQLLSGPKVWYH